MAPLIIDSENLGDKHKKFNKLVQDAITDKKIPDEKKFKEDKLDETNLMKIDIAAYYKDIDYILSVLKSEDMLYVSRAIKQSQWLVDGQYDYIINPDYLNNKLFPDMKTKASIKLMKFIRQYLKTENRIEQFYGNEANPKSAVKWLSRCSVPFIEEHITKHMSHITDLEFKRLCERSITIFEKAMENYSGTNKLMAASFLLHTHADRYLDVLEKNHNLSGILFGPNATASIMKQTPKRIINNFLKYLKHIHIPTFVKYIRREELKEFLLKVANEEIKEVYYEHHYRKMFTFDIIQHFVKRMPKEEQFDFIKTYFIDGENIEKIKDESLIRGTEMFAKKKMYDLVTLHTPVYYWYEFAPFDVAFLEIKKLIQIEDDRSHKYSMLNVLLNCAKSNKKNVLALLSYFFKICLNDKIAEQVMFMNNFLSEILTHKYDKDTWNSFINILTKINYNEKDQQYIEIIIVNNVLNNTPFSETIEKNFVFNSLKKFRKNLNEDEQNTLFQYLINDITNKIEKHETNDEKEFNGAVYTLDQLLTLLLDWDKQLDAYPFALIKIKDLIRIKKDNFWKSDLSGLYNKNKSWRRTMFEDSVTMNPSQSTCINALKHEPELLLRYKDEVNSLCCNDAISLNQLLKKLRVYWPKSLAVNWCEFYLNRLDKPGGQKSLTRGLCTLLSREPLLGLLNKYAPAQPKVDWNNVEEITLTLQRCIAKNMHIARPQPSANAILLYAKGDFLQYALPSLLAIYYNMNRVHCQDHIPKLLDAPVSLQKHGLRFAFIKLNHNELKHYLLNVWKTSKNISIRAVVFVLLYDLLCKETDVNRAEELWEILEVFMNNLTFKEDKSIYKKLQMATEVPDKIKPKFLVKCYNFLKQLIPHAKDVRDSYEFALINLAAYTKEIMEFMCPEFITGIITEYMDEKFFISEDNHLDYGMIRVISSYLLCAKDEETQSKKYNKILAPVIKRLLSGWNKNDKEMLFGKNHFGRLITCLANDLEEYVFKNNMNIPVKMYTKIRDQLEKALEVPQNYVLLTNWKLVVKITYLIEKSNKRENWDDACSVIAPEFGKYCLEVLKQDVESYFPYIYLIYSKALDLTLRLMPDIVVLQISEVMLSDIDFTQAYLVALKNITAKNNYFNTEGDTCEIKKQELRNIIRAHPSVEVKIHYYNTFKDEDGVVRI